MTVTETTRQLGRDMRRLLAWIGILAWAMGQAAAAESVDATGSRFILDETCFGRQYVVFAVDRISPAKLKAEGAKVLGAKGLAALKREVKQVRALMRKPWDEDKWMDEALVLFRQNQAWQPAVHGPINVRAWTAPPPRDWASPEFDDSAWPRLGRSIMVGVPGPGPRDSVDTLGRRMGCFRYRFEVPDPAAAGELTLDLTYRGGARAFVNGAEVARGSLPSGELMDRTRSADYPLEAYVKLAADGGIERRTGRMEGVPVFLDDCFGSFPAPVGDDKPRLGRHGATGGTEAIGRADWERVRKLRDRHIGPVPVPARLLRRGTNVLAVEIRASDLHPITGAFGWRTVFEYSRYNSYSWFHGLLIGLKLRARGSSVPSVRVRPPGVQVWTEDVHTRVMSSRFADRGASPGTIRFVGALNGEFTAQLLVGTDKELKGLTVTAGDLKAAAGEAFIPAAALRIQHMVRHPVTEIGYLYRSGRGVGAKTTPAQAADFVREYGPTDLPLATMKPEEIWAQAERIYYFDHISGAAEAPANERFSEPSQRKLALGESAQRHAIPAVPADSCQPVWLTLAVPSDAKPGKYAGTVRVEAEDMAPVVVPVEAEVIGWRIPSPREHQTILQLEQSPYGVAEHYKMPLWSDEHFRLMESSFRQLGRLGNGWLFVPVLQNTELGNLLDSPLKWVRNRDGRLRFDFSVVDRYLDLAMKHCGRPKVICFLVMHGGTSTAIEVPLLDEAAGATAPHDVSSGSPTYRQDWQAFGEALCDHMASKGLRDVMYWGYMWDTEGDPDLSGVLQQVAPDIRWASGGHGYGYRPYYAANSQIYGLPFGIASLKGWKRPDILLLNPRGGGSVFCCHGGSSPADYRIVVDRALVAGANGVGRVAADYWENIYFRGCKAWHYLIPGMAVASWMLWPGADGAEPSQRLEAFREGVQETEARIYLEQLLDRGQLPEKLADKARQVLFEHQRETYFIDIQGDRDEFFSLWQERSRRLFGVAAEAAAIVGLDVEKTGLTAEVPARGSKQVSLRLRNWTAKPRNWAVAADANWLKPAQSAGSLAGHDDVLLALDTASLPAQQTVKATVTVTDAGSGKTFPVAVTVTTSKVFDFLAPDTDTKRQWFAFKFVPDQGKLPLNVAPGESQSAQPALLNCSAAEVAWKATASVPWVRIEPASGQALPQSAVAVRVTAMPPRDAVGLQEVAVTISEKNGAAEIQIPLAVHVIPPYHRPAAPAAAAPLDAQAYVVLLKTYRGCGRSTIVECDADFKAGNKGQVRGRAFQRCLWTDGPHETVLNVEGKGFTSFSAEVGFPERWMGVPGLSFEPGPENTRINYELYVDGKVRAQSGFMGPKDEFRLLVVGGLEKAKELKLVARTLRLPGDYLHVFWFDPTLRR